MKSGTDGTDGATSPEGPCGKEEPVVIRSQMSRLGLPWAQAPLLSTPGGLKEKGQSTALNSFLPFKLCLPLRVEIPLLQTSEHTHHQSPVYLSVLVSTCILFYSRERGSFFNFKANELSILAPAVSRKLPSVNVLQPKTARDTLVVKQLSLLLVAIFFKKHSMGNWSASQEKGL